MTPQRITLVTLGVADLAASVAFYEKLGWKQHRAQEGVAFFQLQGSALALFGRADLAADQGRPEAALGTGAVTLAQNFPTEAEVDAPSRRRWRRARRRSSGPRRWSGVAIPAIGPIPTAMSGRWP